MPENKTPVKHHRKPYISVRWKKITRDLWANRSRTGLVVLAIAVGVFAFGGMFATRTLLSENMQAGYDAANPATIEITLLNLPQGVERLAQNQPDIASADLRTSHQLYVQTPDGWQRITLIKLEDAAAPDVNRLTIDSGSGQPGRGQLLLERESAGLFPGDVSQVTIETPNDDLRQLDVTGVVHDFSSIPASRLPILTGYVNRDTLVSLGLDATPNTLIVSTREDITTRAELERVASGLEDALNRSGVLTGTVSMTEPGEHWAQDFIEAMVLVFMVLGCLALVLSGILVINTTSAIIGQQKRQIGIMKAIGANFRTVFRLYAMMALAFGVLALFIALPMGAILARLMVRILAGYLNIDVLTLRTPGWVFGLEVAAALLTPVLAALVPVIGAARTSIREAISDYGIRASSSDRLLEWLFARLRGLSRPTMLSLRNTFRRKMRLIFTITTLALAGAIFLSVLNVRVGMLDHFNSIMRMFGYDSQIVLSQPQTQSRLIREANRLDDVAEAEPWNITTGTIIRPDGVSIEAVSTMPSLRPSNRAAPSGMLAGPSGSATNVEEGTTITLLGPPADTGFVWPEMEEGRWLTPGDGDVLVLSSEVQHAEPYLSVGDTVTVSMNGEEHDLLLIGVVNLNGPNFAYVPFETAARMTSGGVSQANAVMVRAAPGASTTNSELGRSIAEHLERVGIPVYTTASPDTLIGVITSQVNFFVTFLIFLALLLGVVGGLGLASTMSLNVIERTREIGVMRAVGAGDGQVQGVFLTEGLVIGLLGYTVGALLSLPVTALFSWLVGVAFFGQTLPITVAGGALILWLVINMGLATVASLAPSRRAGQISIRDALAYE